MRVLACCLFLVTAGSAVAQTSAELRARYGTPESELRSSNGVLASENFALRPTVSLTAQYGSDGRACQLQVVPMLDFDRPGLSLSMTNETASEVLQELAPRQTRGKEFGEGEKDGARYMEYANFVVVQRQGIPGVSGVTISFKREGCPAPQIPFAFLPPPDPETVRRLTPTAQELRKRFGAPDSGTDMEDTFSVEPNIRIIVKYGSDHRACNIKMDPSDGARSYMPKERVSELMDEFAPATIRGKLISDGTFQSSECNGVQLTVYENLLIMRPPKRCQTPLQAENERGVIMQLKRDDCPNPYIEKAKETESR